MARRVLPVLLVGLLVLGLVLTGCGESAKATPTKGAEPTKAADATKIAGTPVVVATPTQAIKMGGTLTYLVAGDVTPVNYDPHYLSDGRREFYRPAYESLMTRDPDTNNVIGQLAESWEFSPDAKSLTVKIRKGVKWQNLAPVNGREFTADDVKWNIERMAKSDPATMQKTFVVNVTGVDVIDKYTAKINFSAANASFLLYLCSGGMEMYPRELFDTYGKEQDKLAIGTGPFIVKSVEKDVAVTLVKNPDYWMPGLPRLDTLKLAIVRGDAAKQAALRAGQGDLMSDQRGTDVEQIKRSMPDLKSYPYASYDIHLRLNTKAKPFSDERVRKAVFLAIDRQDLIKAVEKGAGSMTGYWSAAAKPFARAEAELLKMPGYRLPKDQDIADAKKLLADAGYAGGLAIEVTTSSAVPVYMSTAEALVEQLAKIGVTMKIKVLETTAFSAFSMNKQSVFDAQVTGGGGSSDPEAWAYIFQSTGVVNIGDYGTPEIENLFAAGRAETDLTKRVKLYRDLEDLLFARVSIVPLYSQTLNWVSRTGVEGFKPIAFGHWINPIFKSVWLSK